MILYLYFSLLLKFFDSRVNLTSLDIYVSIERCHFVQEPTDNEFIFLKEMRVN